MTGLALAFAAYASWGLLSPVGKHLLSEGAYAPLGLNAVRFTLAAVVVLAAIGPRSVRATFTVLRRRDVWVFNLLANASLTLFLFSLVRLPAAYATLGFYTAPLWTAAYAWWRLGERVGRAFLPACVGLLGGGYLTLFGWAVPGGVDALGLLMAVASGLVWGLYTVELRRGAPSLELASLMGASFVIGALFYDVLALAVEGVPQLGRPTTTDWGWMGVYVLVPTVAAFVLFNASLQRAPAGLANLLVGAELAFTVLFAALLFHVPFAGVQLVGIAVALLSVTAYLWLREKQPGPPLQHA